MAYSIESSSDNCYPGTACLINKMNIRDEAALADMEAALTLANISLLEQEPISGTFDFAHYKAVHRFLFDELYDWAGHVRTVNLSKKGTRFAPAEEIESMANVIFSRVAEANCFVHDEFETFIQHITDLYCSTNLLHPFRDGNGRTQRAFMTQLIRHAGFDINFDSIDPDELMIATIHAAHGVTDYLQQIFDEAIFEPDQEIDLSIQ